jgi:hypothetical protein
LGELTIDPTQPHAAKVLEEQNRAAQTGHPGTDGVAEGGRLPPINGPAARPGTLIPADSAGSLRTVIGSVVMSSCLAVRTASSPARQP